MLGGRNGRDLAEWAVISDSARGEQTLSTTALPQHQNFPF
jgi:hypothetical protein